MTGASKATKDPRVAAVEARRRAEGIWPSTLPNWNPNTDQHKGALDTYPWGLLNRKRAVARNQLILKVSKVTQGNQEICLIPGSSSRGLLGIHPH